MLPEEDYFITIICDANTKRAQINKANLYVYWSTSESGSLEISGNAGVNPTQSGPPIQLNPSNQNIGSTGGGSSGGGGSGTGTGIPTINVEPPGESPIAYLEAPEFIDISGDTQLPFSISDSTPNIRFFASGTICRWSNTDQSYTNMPSSHNCPIDSSTGSSIGTCNIPTVSDGNIQLHVSCIDSTTGSSNSASNNLDISGEVDTHTPIQSQHSPLSGTNFPPSINGVVVNFVTNEISNCRAGVSQSSSSSFSFNSAPINCGAGATQQSCTISLQPGNNYIFIICRDDTHVFPNIGTAVALNYFVFGTVGDTSTVSSSSGGGGGSSPSSPASDEPPPSEPPPADGDSPPADGDSPPTASVIKQLSPEKNLIDYIITWFKNIFG